MTEKTIKIEKLESALTRGMEYSFFMDKDCEDLKPTKKYPTDSGWDLRARNSGYVKCGSFKTIWTGVHVNLPSGIGAQVRGRSGLAAKGVYVAHGTIDNGYKGEIGVNMHTINPEGFSWSRGDRIAQLVLEPVLDCGNTELKWLERGENGFGSSGIK